MSLCRVAYLTPDGRTVELTKAEREAVMLADRQARREIVKWSGMGQGRGRVILLHRPAGLR